jgi:hypothetical protein
MSTNPQTQRVNDLAQSDGGVWYRLRSEREEICEALLKKRLRAPKTQTELAAVTRGGATLTGNWHRGRLQARLRKIDNALDRLMAGSYGNCTSCGRWIEDTKLDFDPAIAFCIQCWQRMQIQH